MYLNDPTLYGATLPQREIVPPFFPFYGNMPMQGLPMQLPWQNFQKFTPPMYQHGVPPYFQQQIPPYLQQQVPPYFQQQIPPYFQQQIPPYFQQYGYTPFVPPYAQTPWQHSLPTQGYQRPLWY